MKDQIVIDQRQQEVEKLKDHCQEYLEQRRLVRELSKDFKAEVEVHPQYNDALKASEELKNLRSKINSEPLIAELKDKLDTAKERLSLLEDIVTAELKDAQLTMFDFENSHEFFLIDKLKYKKKKNEN